MLQIHRKPGQRLFHALRCGFDDPPVGLMQKHISDILHGKRGFLQHLADHLRDHPDRKPKYLLSVHGKSSGGSVPGRTAKHMTAASVRSQYKGPQTASFFCRYFLLFFFDFSLQYYCTGSVSE